MITVTPLEAWCLLCQVQLACRHPENAGPTCGIAIRIARQFQQQIASTPSLAIIVEQADTRSMTDE